MGPDECHPRIVKEAAEILSKPLCMLINKTFKEGQIPKIWKDANVSALFKNKGFKSLTCISCKICEKNNCQGSGNETYE